MKNNKSLGQHWLKDRYYLDTIASLASIEADITVNPVKTCLEIGPGLGTLTSSLLRLFEEVISVEFDERLAKNLPASFPGKNLKVINADFLKFDLATIKSPYAVAGNIPYYITSPIIEKLLTAENKPSRIVLLIQKEVAERIAEYKCKHSVLSLFCNNYASVELADEVPKEYFTPPPKVDSQILLLIPREAPLVSDEVLDFAMRCFKMPRKKLTANLSTSLGISREKALEWLKTENIPENARPEDISLEKWEALALLSKKD